MELLPDSRVSHLSSILLRKLALLFLALTIVLIPFRFRWTLLTRSIPPIYGDFTDIILFITDVFLIGTLVIWAISHIVEPRPVHFKPLFISIPLAGLTLAGIASTAFSVDKIVTLNNSVRLLLLYGFYLYILNEIKTISQLIIPISIQVVIQSIVAITQSLEQHSLGLVGLQEIALNPAWNGISIVTSNTGRFLRAYGLSDHPNILGGCLAFALIIIAAWYLKSREEWRPLQTGIFAMGVVALLLTFSRAAWLGFLGGALVISIWLIAEQKVVSTIKVARQKVVPISNLLGSQWCDLLKWISLIGASLLIVLPFVWHSASVLETRLNANNSFTNVPTESQSIGERQILVTYANKIFSSRPFTGVGLGTFPIALQQINGVLPFDYQPPHLVLLDVASETGIFGAMFYILMITLPWLMIWIRRERLQFSPEFIGINGALIAVTIVSFLDYYPWGLNPGRLWQWVIWALWGAIYIKSIKKREVND